MKTCFIHKEDRPFFERAGLTGYNDISSLKGDVVSKKGKRPVYRIVLSDGRAQRVFYLKKSPRCPARDLFKRLRKGVGPHGDAYVENAQIELYKKAGIPVMDIAAWGEHHVFGWPVAGFLLASDVPGERLDQVIKTCTDDERKMIFFHYGELIAKMHLNGLRDIARVQDIIYSNDNGIKLTVIDREHGIPKTAPLTENDRADVLARTYLKNLSALGAQDAMQDEMQAFLDGYVSALSSKNGVRQDFEHAICLKISRLVRRKKKFREYQSALYSFSPTESDVAK
jgi:tRNA A-37 threonylcarbamoyl transferase component Bud32